LPYSPKGLIVRAKTVRIPRIIFRAGPPDPISIRRSPVSDYALYLERRTFTCLEWNFDFERVVGADGEQLRSTELSRS
jgi:hypothetical protein